MTPENAATEIERLVTELNANKLRNDLLALEDEALRRVITETIKPNTTFYPALLKRLIKALKEENKVDKKNTLHILNFLFAFGLTADVDVYKKIQRDLNFGAEKASPQVTCDFANLLNHDADSPSSPIRYIKSCRSSKQLQQYLALEETIPNLKTFLAEEEKRMFAQNILFF